MKFFSHETNIWYRTRTYRFTTLILSYSNVDLKVLLNWDTTKYPPLMKTSKLSNSFKYLTQTYLEQVSFTIFLHKRQFLWNVWRFWAHIYILCRYDIQVGIQDPYDDCVATMRLYMRMRSKVHRTQDYPLVSDPQNRNNFASWRQSDLERMTPEQMLEISRSDYYCWCLDSFYPWIWGSQYLFIYEPIYISNY